MDIKKFSDMDQEIKNQYLLTSGCLTVQFRTFVMCMANRMSLKDSSRFS